MDAVIFVEVDHGFLHDLTEGQEVNQCRLIALIEGTYTVIRGKETDEAGRV